MKHLYSQNCHLRFPDGAGTHDNRDMHITGVYSFFNLKGNEENTDTPAKQPRHGRAWRAQLKPTTNPNFCPVEGIGEEAGHGVPKSEKSFLETCYDNSRRHVILLIIYIYSSYHHIALSRNCRVTCPCTRIAVSVSPYRCFVGQK